MRVKLIFPALLLLSTWAGAALADDPGPVASRLENMLANDVEMVGPLELRNEFDTSAGYDLNVFFADQNVIEDYFALITGRSQIAWRSGLIEVNADLLASRREYFEESDQSSTQTAGTLGVSWLFGGPDRATIEAGILRGVDPRTSVDSQPNTTEPVEFEQQRIALAVGQHFTAWSYGVRASAVGVDYEDAVSSITSLPIDQDFRDHEQYGVDVRVGYGVPPGFEVYVRGHADMADFDTNPLSLLDRDSKGKSLLAGVSYGSDTLIKVSVEAGYLQRDFDDPVFTDVDATVGGISVFWVPTPLTNVIVSAERTVTISTLPVNPADTTDLLSLRIDHELARDLIASIGGEIGRDTFEGTAREDNTLGASASLKYLLTPRVILAARYRYFSRDTDFGFIDRDSDQSLATLSFEFHF